MERRAFLRGLLLAPVALPVAAKAMAMAPENVSVMQFTAVPFRVAAPKLAVNGVGLDDLIANAITKSEVYGEPSESSADRRLRVVTMQDGCRATVWYELKPGAVVTDDELAAEPFVALHKCKSMQRVRFYR